LQPTFCAQHKKPKTIPYPRRKCENDGCENIATFGVRFIPERCDIHKQELDRDSVLQRCVVCDEPSVVDEKQQCYGCNNRGQYIRLGRQKQVKAAIDGSGLPKYEFYDKIAYDNTSCGKERPDFLWDCGTYNLILEVDEDQHKSKTCQCEQVRMVNITQGLGTPCLWIRYNPDEYNGQRSTIRDRHRLEFLVKTIKTNLSNPPLGQKEYLRVVYLFFDGFKMNDSPVVETIQCL
jgi:hypothetical protein